MCFLLPLRAARAEACYFLPSGDFKQRFPAQTKGSPHQECSWSVPDDVCAGHAQDAILYCASSVRADASEGAVRLIAADGSPAIDGKGRPEIFVESVWTPVCGSGASSGAAGVLCKSMGFSGASGSSKCSGMDCGDAAPE